MIHVLYVDDEPDLLELGKLFLEQSGDMTVVTTTSAHGALEILRQKIVDAVVSDFQMPDMDGISLLKQIRAGWNGLPFILFTMRGREEVVIEALNNGADFYLQKGDDPTAQFTELRHKIHQAVKRCESDERLLIFNRRYAIMSGINTALVHINHRNEFLDEVCRILAENGKFREVWIGMADAGGKNLHRVASRGFVREFGGSIPVSRIDNPHGISPAIRAIAERSRVVYPDIRTRVDDGGPGELQPPSSHHSTGAFPLRQQGSVTGVLQISEAGPQFFDETGILLTEEICQSVSFALEKFELEEQREKTEHALLESEEKFRTLAEDAPIGIYVIREDRFLHVNPEFERIFGYPPDEIIGKLNVPDIAAEESRALMTENIRLCLSGRQKSVRYAFTGRRKDGSITEVEMAGTRMFSHGHAIIIGTLIEITRRERDPADQQDRGEKNPIERDIHHSGRNHSILGNLTRHDIANRLTALRGRLKIMKKMVTDPEILDEIRKVEDAGRDIYTFLETARVYHEIGYLPPTWQNVTAMIRQEYELLGSTSLSLVLDLPEDLEIHADPLCSRVFTNLFDNTLRHGVHATEVRISLRKSLEGVVIIWEDNGIGIPLEKKDLIFSRKPGDTAGLGLSLCREILAITGISLKETGNSGQGARFEISVPGDTYRSEPRQRIAPE